MSLRVCFILLSVTFLLIPPTPNMKSFTSMAPQAIHIEPCPHILETQHDEELYSRPCMCHQTQSRPLLHFSAQFFFLFIWNFKMIWIKCPNLKLRFGCFSWQSSKSHMICSRTIRKLERGRGYLCGYFGYDKCSYFFNKKAGFGVQRVYRCILISFIFDGQDSQTLLSSGFMYFFI